jgi:adenylate cyclase
MGAVAAVAFYLAGLDRPAEHYALDLRFAYCSKLEAPESILHVDIDDRALEELGRWPWPRAMLAGVVDVLGECGAEAIALDIIFPDPQKVRYVSAADEVYAGDLNAPLLIEAPPLPVFDDAVLAEVIARHGAVLGMHIDLADSAANKDARSARDNETVALLGRFAVPEEHVAGRPLAGGKVVPPLGPLVRSAGGCGFVTATQTDRVVRHVRLLGKGDGQTFPQLALLLAAARLTGSDQPARHIYADASSVTIRHDDKTLARIPVDKEGRMLVNWVAAGRPQAEQISAAAVGAIWRQRQRLVDNRRRLRLVQVQLAGKLQQERLLALFTNADGLSARRITAQRASYLAQLRGQTGALPELVELRAEEARLEEQIDEAAAEFREELDAFYLADVPEDPEDKRLYDELAGHRDYWDTLVAKNEQIQRDIDGLLLRIRSRVAGKVCLVGANYTGGPDFVNSPVRPMTPGVVVQGQAINTILSGNFVRPAGWWLSVVVIVAMGGLVSLVAASRPMLHAAVAAVGLSTAYVFVNAYVAFADMGVWLPVVAPLVAVAASFLVVAVYRQLTEERAKRQIKSMFAHALSPQLVDQLLTDPSLAELGGQKRAVTCMFSDLAGFTPLSGRLGPQATVRVLNQYFDRMTEVVQNRGGGYLNKFLGDGIFCFFGAPVMQDDHSARAIRSAVACLEQVAELNETFATESDESVALSVRVGIAGGEAMVGNCGSTERMDYTAIGNCVNLASRLESANKFLGTRILVAQSTWRQAGCDDLLARPIGSAWIVGVSERVRVWHVLGDGEGDEEIRRAFEEFGRAVALYESGELAQAREIFLHVREVLPTDNAAATYAALCDYGLMWSAGHAWRPECDGDGTIRIAAPADVDQVNPF